MFNRRVMMGAVLASLGLNTAAFADGPLKVEKVDGHVSPVAVEVTYKKPDSPKMSGLVWASSNSADAFWISRHQLDFAEDGDAEGQVWLDTITSISDTTDEAALITFKDGSQKRIRYIKGKKKYLVTATPDGSRIMVELEQIKEVRFLKSARKDLDGNAMFDQWKFSPFTGEKLPTAQ